VKQIASVIPFASKKKKEPSPLSKRQNQIIKLAGDLAEQTREEAGALAFMSRLLIMVNLPYRDPGKDCKNWHRKNGNISINVSTGYEDQTPIGIPYGAYPRLILAFLVTQAVKTQSPMLYLGKSFSDFIKLIGIEKGGKTRKQLQKQLERTLSASFAWTYRTDKQWSRANIQVSRNSQLWWDEKQPEQQALWESYINLNTDFFNEIIRNAVPLDLRVLSTLKNSPLGLDLYMFISWRVFKIDKPVFISWESLQEQLGGQYIDVNVFSRDCRSHIRKIQALRPELNVTFVKGRLCLKPSFYQTQP
jgi:hypothetical protein